MLVSMAVSSARVARLACTWPSDTPCVPEVVLGGDVVKGERGEWDPLPPLPLPILWTSVPGLISLASPLCIII